VQGQEEPSAQRRKTNDHQHFVGNAAVANYCQSLAQLDRSEAPQAIERDVVQSYWIIKDLS
jgi:hypothetical protein